MHLRHYNTLSDLEIITLSDFPNIHEFSFNEPTMEKPRRYAVDLIPQLILSRGDCITSLINVGLHKSVEFQAFV